MELRCFGTTLIQEGGTLLDVPQVVMATGQVLFHRFFCKKSMAHYDVEVRESPHALSCPAKITVNIHPFSRAEGSPSGAGCSYDSMLACL